jgi:hypothetical protein
MNWKSTGVQRKPGLACRDVRLFQEKTVNKATDDNGLITVILERLEKQRLPRLFSIKDRVDAGEPPDDMDLEFLESAIEDARKLIPLIDRHPEYQHLASQVMSLYKEIADKALQIGR